MALTDRDPNNEGSPHWRIVFGVILGVGLTFAGTQIFNQSKSASNGPASNSTHHLTSGEGGGASSLTAPPSPYQDPIGREERALAVTKLESFREQANSVLEALKVLEKEMTRWEVDVEPLLFNGEGKWIAGDEALVRYFQKLMEEDRMTPITVSSIRTQVDEMLTPVIQAIQDPSELYVPSLDLSKALTKLHGNVYYGAKTYQKQRSQILAMVEDSKGSGGEQSSITLQTAIARLEGEKTRRQADLIARREREAEEAIAQRLAIVRKQTLEREAAAEEAILFERQKTADQQLELERKSMEDQRLKAMAADQNVQKEFLPFLAKGRYTLYTSDYRSGGTHYAEKWNYEKKFSVAYNHLAGFGAYNDFDAFVKIATKPITSLRYPGKSDRAGAINDRPLWRAPKTEQDWEDYRKKWNLFKKLTPYWLESGVLHQF